jgi:hypothetical protein
VLIVGAEIVKDTWIPVLFSFLPDKKLESYMTVLEGLKSLLEDRGLELLAQYAMSDFEQNIRKSVNRVFPQLEAKGKNNSFYNFKVDCSGERHRVCHKNLRILKLQ